MMFRRTFWKPSSVWSMGCPIYQGVSTFYTLSSPYSSYRLNSIFPKIAAISTSLYQRLLSFNLWHLSNCLCLNIPATCMGIPHWSHGGNGSGPSYKMDTFNFQWQNIKCSLSLTIFSRWPGIPPPGSPLNLGSEGMTPYIPSVLLPWRPPPSPAATIYHVRYMYSRICVFI